MSCICSYAYTPEVPAKDVPQEYVLPLSMGETWSAWCEPDHSKIASGHRERLVSIPIHPNGCPRRKETSQCRTFRCQHRQPHLVKARQPHRNVQIARRILTALCLQAHMRRVRVQRRELRKALAWRGGHTSQHRQAPMRVPCRHPVIPTGRLGVYEGPVQASLHATVMRGLRVSRAFGEQAFVTDNFQRQKQPGGYETKGCHIAVYAL